MDRGELISVRTEVVLSAMVESIVEAVLTRAQQPLDAAPAAGDVLEGIDPTPAIDALARLGWESRQVEIERFAPARDPWPPESLSALELARAEPLARPEPDDPNAVSWRVPGPGGHVRHYVALRCIGSCPEAVADAHAAGLLDPTALKRVWLYGFLLAAAG